MLVDVTSITRLLPESAISVLPLASRLAKAGPLRSAGLGVVGYCQATLPAPSTSMTRSLPSSAMRVWPLVRRWALLGGRERARGVEIRRVLPRVIDLLGVTSMTRLFPWSVMRTLPLASRSGHGDRGAWQLIGAVAADAVLAVLAR